MPNFLSEISKPFGKASRKRVFFSQWNGGRPFAARSGSRGRARALAGSGAALAALTAAVLVAPPASSKFLLAPSQQATGASSIVVPAQADLTAFKVTDVSGPAGQPIALNIELSGLSEKNAGQLFLFTGVPEGIKLTPGGYFGDFWAITSKDLPNLTMTAPDNFSGTFQVKITRTRSQSSSARSATMTVRIGEPSGNQVAAPASSGSNTSAARQSEARMMTRANELFKKGDVSGARAIYEYLATKGSAPAAIAMGETYDPSVLGKLFIKGLDANPEKAQEWYQMAEELGSGEARSRLNALAAQ